MRKEKETSAMQNGAYEAPELCVVKVEIERGFSESNKFLLGAEDADEDGMIY